VRGGSLHASTFAFKFEIPHWRNMEKGRLMIVLGMLLHSCRSMLGRRERQWRQHNSKPFPNFPIAWWTNFFKNSPKGMTAGEASGVAVNSKGHIFLFQRTKPMLAEYDEKGNFIQAIGDGLFLHPHGLRIDTDDNIWTTDDGNHLVLKLDPSGNVLLVLGRINTGAEANWLFNKPADVAFAKEWRYLCRGWLWQFARREV